MFLVRVGVGALFSALSALPLLICLTSETFAYSRAQMLSTSTEVGEGFETVEIDVGLDGFAFTTILPTGTTITSLDDPEAPVIRGRMDLANPPAPVSLSVRHLTFAAFADASVVSYGYHAMLGLNRVSLAAEQSNQAFALSVAAIVVGQDQYSRMDRAAVVSRGDEVLIIHASFQHADYEVLEPILARIFGGMRMKDDTAIADAFETVDSTVGPKFFVPTGWTLIEDEDNSLSRADYRLTIRDLEYPNLSVELHGNGDLEDGREIIEELTAAFTQSIDDSELASFTGEPEIDTHEASTGEAVVHSYGRDWVVNESGMPMRSEVVTMRAAEDGVVISMLNTPDLLAYRARDDVSMLSTMFQRWVVARSASNVVNGSIRHGLEPARERFDIRAVGR